MNERIHNNTRYSFSGGHRIESGPSAHSPEKSYNKTAPFYSRISGLGRYPSVHIGQAGMIY